MKTRFFFYLLAAVCILGLCGPAFSQEGSGSAQDIPLGDAGDPRARDASGSEPTENQPVQRPESPGIQAFLPMILIMVVFWFFISGSQRKQRKRQQDLLSNLRSGDRVVTAGGIRGIIRGQNDEAGTVSLEVAKNIRIDISKTSISGVLNRDGAAGETTETLEKN